MQSTPWAAQLWATVESASHTSDNSKPSWVATAQILSNILIACGNTVPIQQLSSILFYTLQTIRIHTT